MATPILSGCTAGPGASQPVAAINHFVFFKLDDPARADDLIRDCRERIVTIPSVASHYVGRHHDIGRPGVDSGYDVGLYVGFDNEADYLAYLDHPDHLELVGNWRDQWEWIRIYDVGAP